MSDQVYEFVVWIERYNGEIVLEPNTMRLEASDAERAAVIFIRRLIEGDIFPMEWHPRTGREFVTGKARGYQVAVRHATPIELNDSGRSRVPTERFIVECNVPTRNQP